MRIIWLTDLHLNFIYPEGVELFIEELRESKPDAILIGGDIGEAHNLISYLKQFESSLNCPIYFVLGNHDFYGSSIKKVRSAVETLDSDSPNLIWLNKARVIKLADDIALIGHDSWADGGFGDYANSKMLLNDYFVIDEFIGLSKGKRLLLMRSLAREAADHLSQLLPEALSIADHVICLTHVPPFKEACLHQGEISDDSALPHFSSKLVGIVLQRIMTMHPDKRMTVLCGHTHGGGDVHILDNLHVIAGLSEYGMPQIQRIIDIE